MLDLPYKSFPKFVGFTLGVAGSLAALAYLTPENLKAYIKI